MATRGGGNRRDPVLRPSRWPTPPRPGALLRVGLVALLLLLAAAVLYTADECPTAPGPPVRPGHPGAALAGGTPTPSVPSPDPGDAAGPSDPGGADSGAPGGGHPLPLPAGTVGVPVRLAEPAALAVVRPGNRVDLLAVPPDGSGRGAPALLAPAALVLDVVDPGSTDGSAALYLALPPDQARRTVGVAEGTRFSVVVRP